ncbi:MAG: VPLPA-CTERM sorting domain-containing protein [Pseudomonadota bacterium]
MISKMTGYCTAAAVAMTLTAGAANAASISVSGFYSNLDTYQFTEGTYTAELLPDPLTTYTGVSVWEAGYSLTLSSPSFGTFSSDDSIVFGPTTLIDTIPDALALLTSAIPTLGPAELGFLGGVAIDVAAEAIGNLGPGTTTDFETFGYVDADTDGFDDFYFEVDGDVGPGIAVSGSYFIEALLDLTPYIAALGGEYLDPVFGAGTGTFLASIEELEYTLEAFVRPAPIPLPAGAVLMGTALLGLGVAARRRKQIA